MASFSLRRGDLNVHNANEDQFGLRWHRLLFPISGTGPLHLGVVEDAAAAPAPQNHSEPTLTAPLDAESTQAPTPEDTAAPSPAGGATDAPPIPEAANPFGGPDSLWHPPFLTDTPLADSSATVPHDAGPPGGFIPKSDAIVWSGPAIMVFPGEPHDAGTDTNTAASSGSAAAAEAGAHGGDGGNTAADPGTADTGTAGAGGTADTGTSDAGGTADAGTPPDDTNIGLVLTRGDLDPLLTAMGGGADHAAGDLGNAFQSADDGHLPLLGLDLGLVTSLPPMPPPPPPEVI